MGTDEIEIAETLERKQPEKRASFGIHTGISSLLMLLVVLCLATFGLLSFSTARADRALTDRALEHTEHYYAAERAAAGTVARIDGLLAEFSSSAQTEEALDTLLAQIPKKVPGVQVEGRVLTFETQVDETQKMITTVHVAPVGPSSTAGKNRCTFRNQLVSTQEFEDETYLNVWQG